MVKRQEEKEIDSLQDMFQGNEFKLSHPIQKNAEALYG